MALIAVYIDGLYLMIFRETSPEIQYFNFANFPAFISRIALSMEGVALMPGLYASTKEKSKFQTVVRSAAIADGTLMMLVSIIGYLAYGNSTSEIVLMNLSYGVLSNIVQLSYSFGVLCSFCLQLFPILEIIESKQYYETFAKMFKDLRKNT